jgi:hypothetical protein
MNYGAHQSGTGQQVFNWITATWFTILTKFVSKSFICQHFKLADLVKHENVTFFDIHVRYWKGKLRLSNGLVLFNLTFNDIIEILHSREYPYKYRIIYDDLLPNSIWNFKFFRRVDKIFDDVLERIANEIRVLGLEKNLINVSFASNPTKGLVLDKSYTYRIPDRPYTDNQFGLFMAWLKDQPQGEKDIIIAAPNDVFSLVYDIKHFPVVFDNQAWALGIYNWIASQKDSKATYLVNFL